MLPPGDWKAELLTPIAGAIAEITRKKHALRKFKHRDGKKLWRIVRNRIQVIATMKNMLQNKDLNKTDDDANDEDDHSVEKNENIGLFPTRGDCPLKNKFCEISKKTH